MATIGLRRLWVDDDGMIQVELVASNGRQSTTQDFYTYPQDIESFGRSLSEFFPKLGKGEVTFEYGAEGERVYSFVSLKAFYISLHSIGILIRTNNNREGHESAASRFCIEAPLSTVNALGLQISKWAAAPNTALSFEFGHA